MRYNKLIRRITNELKSLDQKLEAKLKLDKSAQDLLNMIMKGETPQHWVRQGFLSILNIKGYMN